MNSVGRDDSCTDNGRGGSLDGGAGATTGKPVEVGKDGRWTLDRAGEPGGVAVQAEGWTARCTVRGAVVGYSGWRSSRT